MDHISIGNNFLLMTGLYVQSQDHSTDGMHLDSGSRELEHRSLGEIGEEKHFLKGNAKTQ